jgi:hypothetical protein
MEATDPSSAVSLLKWRNGRAASTNNPEALSRVSHQAQTRRRHDLIRVFVDALGGRDAVSDVALMQVKKAAELLALAEMVRAKMLGDPGRDVTGLVRLEGEARRTLAALGIKSDVPKVPLALQQRRRARWDAQAQPSENNSKAAKAVRRETKPHAKRERPPGHDKTQTDD